MDTSARILKGKVLNVPVATSMTWFGARASPYQKVNTAVVMVASLNKNQVRSKNGLYSVFLFYNCYFPECQLKCISVTLLNKGMSLILSTVAKLCKTTVVFT